MDIQQILRYGVSGASISHESFGDNAQVFSEWMYGPAKFELRDVVNSPLSVLSSSSEVVPSCSSVGWNIPFRQISPSPTRFSDGVQISSGESSGSHDQSSIQSMRCALRKIETALMGPDADDECIDGTTCDPVDGNTQMEASNHRLGSFGHELRQDYKIQPHPTITPRTKKSSHVAPVEKRLRVMKGPLPKDPLGKMKLLLIECAKSLSEGRNDFDRLIQDARSVVSVSGEPIQRVGAYLVEGLIARKEKSGTNVYRALKCKQPESKDLLSYMSILYENCPYLKFGYMAANGAIAEAIKNEDRVHIIDFRISQGTQWATLIEALAARQSGPPHVRITGVDDPVSRYARGGSLEAVGERLAALSKKFNIPIEFHAVPVFAQDITREMLDVRAGEALAVNFPLQLHHMPDESIDVKNPRDEMLRMVRSLSPKVVTLIEQDSNTNTTPFLTRFKEALEYYSVMFESIDVTIPRDSKERIGVEQQCLARDIVNVIACEGRERMERHELLGKWKSRFTMAGFTPFPLSSHVNSVIRGLLRRYSEHYMLVEKEGAMLLGWKDRNLVSASAWH